MNHVPPLLVGPLAAAHRENLRIEVTRRDGRTSTTALRHCARSLLSRIAGAAGSTSRRPTHRPTTAAAG